MARSRRNDLADVGLGQDYIRPERARGAGAWRVVLAHGMGNAILSILAMIGLDVGNLLSGAVVVESVYGWPEDLDDPATKADAITDPAKASERLAAWKAIYKQVTADAPWVPVYNEKFSVSKTSRVRVRARS